MDTSHAMPAAATKTEKPNQSDLKLVANDNQKMSAKDPREQASTSQDDFDDMWDNVPI